MDSEYDGKGMSFFVGSEYLQSFYVNTGYLLYYSAALEEETSGMVKSRIGLEFGYCTLILIWVRIRRQALLRECGIHHRVEYSLSPTVLPRRQCSLPSEPSTL